ncbi:MAG: hypothetical protein KIT14_10725 [bacterium]|nr:hypothetical protein [bacterium]
MTTTVRTGAATVGLLLLFVLVCVAVPEPGWPAAKKPCARLCREPVAACRQQVVAAHACTTLRGSARRACRRAQRPERKRCRRLLLTACRADPASDRCLADGRAPVDTPSAWEAVLADVERAGVVTVDTARAAFALLVAPLPGVPTPPGATAGTAAAVGHDTGDVGGCAALRWIRAFRDQLTPEQRDAVDAALARATAVPAPAATPAADTTRDAASDAMRFRRLVDDAVAAIGARLGVPLAVPIEVVFMEPAKPGAPAALEALDAAGDAAGPLARCRLYVAARARVDPDAATVRGTITHEVFHCFQAQLAGLARYVDVTAPQWLDEGGANWVAADVVGIYAGVDSTWADWFRKPAVPLDRRTYSGMGVFAEAAWLGAKPWALFPTLTRATTHGAAFGVLSAPVAVRLQRSWAASLLRLPARGAEWDVQGGGVPGHALVPPETTLPEGDVEAVDVAPYAASALRLTAAAPNLLVDVAGGNVRLADAAGRDLVAPAGTLLCTAPPCTCPSGAPPPGTTLDVRLPLDVAVTGWSTGARGALTGLSVAERCRYDPTNATGFCRALQPLTTLGPALATALLEGTPADLRAAWGPWKDTIVLAAPVPAPIAAAWAGVVRAYGDVTTAYYEAIGYDIVDALVCEEGESAEECAYEITLSEAYAEAIADRHGDLVAADAYLREVCGFPLALEFDF